MTLTPEHRRANRFDKLRRTATQYQLGTYMAKFTAPSFQRMIRAEYGARLDGVPFVNSEGILEIGFASSGQVICVTCGKVGPWEGNYFGGQFHTGHFLASRAASIVLEETNVAPQCAYCNKTGNGEQARYEVWMRHVHGQDEIDRLRRLKNTARQFTLDELVELRIGYMDRITAAKARMK